MAVEIFIEDLDLQSSSYSFIPEFYKKFIESKNFIVGDINVILCSDEYLLNVNVEYLNHDYYTDIITFNMCEDNVVNSDLFISVDRVKENSSNYGVEFKIEFVRVLAHGILHLIGFDDADEVLKLEMRREEDLAIKLFKDLIDEQ